MFLAAVRARRVRVLERELGSKLRRSRQGLDHVIFVTALEGKLLLRQYVIALKKSGTRIPRVELLEMGPSLDLALRRVREAPPDLMAEAMRQPKTTGKKVRASGLTRDTFRS